MITSPKRTGWMRFLKFIAVGMTGTVLDFGILALLKEWAHFPTLPANIISFSAAMVNNFTWNYLWTFRDRRSGKMVMQFMKFLIIAMLGLVLNSLTLLALEKPMGALFGIPQQGYLPSKVIASTVVMLWNFFVNKWWNFRSTASENI
jgi:dolichol-phosphate mannosyltransferase